MKNRVCTAVKKSINFDSVGNNYILKEGRSLDDYKKEEKNYETTSNLPTVSCPSTAPFTVNRDDCFSCSDPTPNFNFETKKCQSCSADEKYDAKTRKCVKRQIYTLLSSTTEKTLKQGDNYTIAQYKADQAKIKSQQGS